MNVHTAAYEGTIKYESIYTNTDIKKSLVYDFTKRFVDIIFSLLSIIILLPLMLIIAMIIKIDSKGSVFFIQQRCGKDGKVFKMYKFRSMIKDADKLKKKLINKNEADGPVFKMRDDPRITKIGKFIRKTSIDELPQLFNILKGDMSIVGPRPPIVNEVDTYNDYEMQRLLVKPGLTCYWQISGRSNISFDDWVRLDIKYINERSLWVDTKIFFKTIPVVLKCDGAY